jgi:anaerobic magnesium-protoporphyrin IX monomethyl ester cyclase
MINFLIVVPRLAKFNTEYIFPIGILYISANLKKYGYNVTCLNLCSYPEPVHEVLSECISKNNIHVICTGGVAMHWHQIAEVLVVAKQIKPQSITIAGGAIISSDPELAMRNIPIDIGVIGEGELTIVELANCLSNNGNLSAVKGIVCLDSISGTLHFTEERPPIADLDSLPLPDYESFDYSDYIKIRSRKYPFYEPRLFDIGEEQIYGEVLGSRSCPFDCTFCYHPLGKKYRQRSVKEVINEIKFLIAKFNINFISMLDELFSTDEKRIYEFIEEFSKLDIQWTAQWRVDNVNEDVLKALKKSGMHAIGLGLESVSDTVLTSMRKKTSRAKIDSAYSMAFKNGVIPGGNLIFGDIAETESTMAETLDWWFAHPEYTVGIKFIMTLPDSHIYRYALEKNLITDKLKYITGQAWEINLTTLTNERYNDLRTFITYLDHTWANLHSGKILDLKIDTSSDKAIYKAVFKCPHCEQISSYHYYYSESDVHEKYFYTVVLCKQCSIRFKIESIQCFPADIYPTDEYYEIKFRCVAI